MPHLLRHECAEDAWYGADGIIPLMKYTHDRSLMGDYVDGPVKFAINMVVVSLIVALNVILVILTLSGRS